MKSTFSTLFCLLFLTGVVSAQTIDDDMKAIREHLRVKNASGPYIAKHAEKRIKDWRAEAEKGNAAAQWLLGRCYLQGVGGEKENAEEGAKWLKKSAEQGFGIAENNLGLLYEEGTGVARDQAEAVKWLTKGAERGEFVAQYNLARLYRDGIDGKKDSAAALKWYKKAGDQKHLASLTELGQMYERGKGVEADEKEAIKWYRAGAQAGDPMATARAIVVYQESISLRQSADDIKALKDKLTEQVGKEAEEYILRATIQRDPQNKQAPNAKGTINGKAFALNDYKGKVVVLKFSATWCGPCKAMLPHQEKMLKRLQDEPFTILDVDIDANEELADQWDITSVPSIYIIDAKGIIRETNVRGEKLDEVVDKLLAAMKEKK